MACKRPHTCIVLASQKNRMSIGKEMLALDMEIAEVRMNRFWRYSRLRLLSGEIYLAYYTIPIGLRILSIGMATGIQLFWHATTIINHHRQHMSARAQFCSNLKHLRR